MTAVLSPPSDSFIICPNVSLLQPNLGTQTDHEFLSALTPHNTTGTGFVWGREGFYLVLSCPKHVGPGAGGEGSSVRTAKGHQASSLEPEDYSAPHPACLDTSGMTVTPGDVPVCFLQLTLGPTPA